MNDSLPSFAPPLRAVPNLSAEIRHWLRDLEDVQGILDRVHDEIHADTEPLMRGEQRELLHRVLLTVHMLRGHTRMARTHLDRALNHTTNTVTMIPGGDHQ